MRSWHDTPIETRLRAPPRQEQHCLGLALLVRLDEKLALGALAQKAAQKAAPTVAKTAAQTIVAIEAVRPSAAGAARAM